MVFNPGGPGGSGIDALATHLDKFAGLRKARDVVTWDPRGAPGRSTPIEAAECFHGPRFRAIRDRDDYAAILKEGTANVQACRKAAGPLVDHLDSASSARDLEAIRVAVGDDRLTYFGNSYGGILGSSYARMFPSRVRAMYLDSVVEHVNRTRVRNAAAYRSLERLFDRFVQWCRASAECPIDSDARSAWRSLVEVARQHPIPIKGAEPATFDDAELVFWATYLLVDEDWPQFAAAIVKASNGDASGFVQHGHLEFPEVPTLVLAMQCADGLRYSGYGELAAARRAADRQTPTFAGERETYTAVCAGWPAPIANPPGPLPTRSLPPLLGAAPLLERESVEDTLAGIDGSRIIRYPQTGHGLYLNVGNKCVIAIADRYLIDGDLPSVDPVCEPE